MWLKLGCSSNRTSSTWGNINVSAAIQESCNKMWDPNECLIRADVPVLHGKSQQCSVCRVWATTVGLRGSLKTVIYTFICWQELTSVGLTYPHMPILRLHATWFHERLVASMMFTSVHLYGNVYMRVGVAHVLAALSHFGRLGEQSSQKWEIHYIGRWWTAEKNLTLLALSLLEISVTVQTRTQKTQTNSNWYIHTLPIGMCG